MALFTDERKVIMGLQDRDYYRDKHKKVLEDRDYTVNQTDSSNYPYNTKYRTNKFLYFIPVILSMLAIWYGADPLLRYIKYKQQPKIIYVPVPVERQRQARTSTFLKPIKKPYSNAIPGELRIKADNQGHFRGTVFINNVPMQFLIDTGATTTVIPGKFASSARLPHGNFIQTNTAGGKATARETTIKNFKLGNIVINNLDAQINDHLHEALIGMNTLRLFNISQNNGILTLTPNSRAVTRTHNERQPFSANTAAVNQTTRKPTVIKKTVTCDKNNVCTTKYSDH